jgi:hypothetical protein
MPTIRRLPYRLYIHRKDFTIRISFIENEFGHVALPVSRPDDLLETSLAQQFGEKIKVVEKLMKIIEAEQKIHRLDVRLAALPAFLEIAGVALQIGPRQIPRVVNNDPRASTGLQDPMTLAEKRRDGMGKIEMVAKMLAKNERDRLVVERQRASEIHADFGARRNIEPDPSRTLYAAARDVDL